MVLIVALAIAEDGIAWQFNTKPWLLSTLDVCALLVNQATEISTLLALVHEIFGGHPALVFTINEGDLQAIGKLVEHPIGMVELCLIEVLVHLHRNQTSEAITWVPHAFICKLAHVISSVYLCFVVTLQCRVIHAHPRNGSPQRLHAHRTPSIELIPMFCCVLIPLAASQRPAFTVATRLHASGKRGKLLFPMVLDPIDQWDSVRNIRSLGIELLLLHQD
mmetsp:Transcript_77844/g.134892  ORF Transcript_77844/g.134892 Transcript_77844/m.134892 type:complete len:220 (+) Transcript_77844:2361-3020(+)